MCIVAETTIMKYIHYTLQMNDCEKTTGYIDGDLNG